MLQPIIFARVCWISLALAASIALAEIKAAAAERVEFRKNDRIVLLGGTFVERLQVYGQFETELLAAHRELHLTFRNLGWSGDTVWGEARAVFGGPQDGFKRLVKDVEDAKPTLLLIQYGANEAHAGAAGLLDFATQYEKLLDALAATRSRIVLLSPVRRERVSQTVPDPAPYNAILKQYCDAIQQIADQRKVDYLDLQDLYDDPPFAEGPDGRSPLRFTDNGLHPNEAGSALVSDRLLAKLGVATGRWNIEFSRDSVKASDIRVQEVVRTRDSLRFQATAKQLPPPTIHSNRQPWNVGFASRAAKPLKSPNSHCRLRVVGLDTGHYELLVDGKQVATADSSQWGDPGVGFEIPSDVAQSDAVRQLIYDKNVLYFHRYRPQNETYLFLFRKHEQGNNAVEIPQFDPLIAEKEAEAAKRLAPALHRFELRKAP